MPYCVCPEARAVDLAARRVTLIAGGVNMKCNVGGKDRMARFFIGGAGVALALFAPIGRPWRILAGTLGAIGLATASTQYCPANQLLHVDSCMPHEIEKESEHQLTLNYR